MDTPIEIVPGMPDAPAEPLGRAERLARRAALDARNAELALAYIAAGWSGLEPGRTLFRHEPPAETLDAVWLRLTGETPDASPDHRSFTVLLAGREVTPGMVSPGIFALLGKLPATWLTVTGGALASPVTAAELKLVRPACFGSAFSGGRRVAAFDAELSVRICTAPPR
jgi:hypothetical protein